MAHRCKFTTISSTISFLVTPYSYYSQKNIPETIDPELDSSLNEKNAKKKIFISSKESYGKAVASRERNSWTLHKRKRCTTQTFRPANKRDEQQEGEGRGRAWKEKNSNTSLGLRHDLNARFYERQGICIPSPLLPRTIKANRILDDPCRYPAFNLYTTSGVVLQRRGINGARTPVSSSAEQKSRRVSWFFLFRDAPLLDRFRLPQKRRESSAITRTGEDILEYFLHDSTAVRMWRIWGRPIGEEAEGSQRRW